MAVNVVKRNSCCPDEPQQGTHHEFRRRDRVTAQMKMRRAVARTDTARVAAKGDGLTLFVAAIRIPAIAVLQVGQRQMPRLDLDAAQLLRLDLLEHRRRPTKCGHPE